MAALDFQPTDRMGLFDSFWGEFVEQWRRAKGLGPEVSIDDYYGIDIAICVADETAFPSRAGVIEERGSETISRDGWGRVSRTAPGRFFSETLDSAYADRAAFDRVPFEPPDLDSRYEGFLQQVAAEREKRCVFCKIGGPYLRTAFVRGQVDFLMDIASDVPFAKALVDRMADHLTQIGLESLRRGNLWDTGLWIYDDMCNNENPMVSPAKWEEIFFPAYRRMVQAFKEAGAKKVVLHCDGHLTPLLDLVIEAGIDAINPVEPKAHMDVVALKERYGRRLAYVGGMCNAQVLPRGTKAEIRRAVERIKEAAQDGGIIIGTHSIGPDVPVENYDYYHRVAME